MNDLPPTMIAAAAYTGLEFLRFTMPSGRHIAAIAVAIARSAVR